MADVRVRIDAPSGIVELDGDRDFVSAYLDKLLPLIQEAGLGRRGHSTAPAVIQEETAGIAHSEAQNGSETGKKKRRVTKPAPAGQSCRDRINVLKNDDFFKEHRTPTEIVTGLSKKGWTHNVNQVSAAIGQMFEKGELQRTKNDNSAGFAYFWDRT
jgi:hypothetical protein